MYHHFDKNSFRDKCEQFQIPLNKQIRNFSTGMRAKLKLLIALSHEAKLLILDEPTAGLDVVARDELLDMMRDYMETPNRGILISSHIAGDLESLCDDIYMLEKGEVILHEDTDVLLNEYGVLKVTDEQYADMDKNYIVRQKKENWGWQLLTDQKQYYQENARGLAIGKGGIADSDTNESRGCFKHLSGGGTGVYAGKQEVFAASVFTELFSASFSDRHCIASF